MSFFTTDFAPYEGQVEIDLLPQIAVQFGRFMNSLAGRPSQGLYLGAALVSHMTMQGHVCLDLSSVEGRALYDDQGNVICHCPPFDIWKRDLLDSGVVARSGDPAPLILDDQGRLYLYRYWQYENSLAKHLLNRSNEDLVKHDPERLGNLLGKYFPSINSNEIDWQALAAFVSTTKRLCVISGGPGTGKTSTVCKILGLVLELNTSFSPRIVLAAPTGKAAARLEEGIKDRREDLPAPPQIREMIPQHASTIHRLLGARASSPYFLHNKDNPLPVDIVVVDEASMVDLPLMAKLFDALEPDTHVFLLGDKDQLASVEAGAVLGDICSETNVKTFSAGFIEAVGQVLPFSLKGLGQGSESTGLYDCVVQLTKNYRFGEQSGIGALARAVNSGNADAVLDILGSSRFSDVRWYPLPSPSSLASGLTRTIISEYGAYLQDGDVAEKFSHLDNYRILCALRHGPYGLFTINQIVQRILERHGLAAPLGEIYPGLPLLVTKNDYDLGIFNGDLGIVVQTEGGDDTMSVAFRNPDGSIRMIHPTRLPEYEMAYAMSIHKAQGSEFDRITIVLPDTDVPILTRELLYTAITRAREGVEIWAKEEILRKMVLRRIWRSSGLKEALS